MPIEAAIKTICTGNAAVAAVIADRVFPQYIDQGVTGAAVTYQEIDGEDDYSVQGPVGLPDRRFTFNCWSATVDAGGSHDQCLTLFEAMRALWANYIGTAGGLVIQGTYIANRGDVPDVHSQVEGQSRWGKFLDVIISHEE